MQQSDDQLIRIGQFTSEFRLKDKLGNGSYGSVYKGYQIGNSKNKVAIKLISLKKSTREQVETEVEYLLNYRSQGTLEILGKKIIKLHPNGQEYYAIVTQKMDGSIRELLQEKAKISEKQAIKWAYKIIGCYKYLYKAKVLHRDLKPENVLYRKFGDQIIFKIADFGNARSAMDSKSLTIGQGTQYYMSPQQATEGKYTNKTDVYAFGCMIFEFLVGSGQVSTILLESGEINKQMVKQKLSNLGISEMMIQLIQGCLQYEEKNRLSWQDVFSHPIFKKNQQPKEIRVDDKIKVKKIWQKLFFIILLLLMLYYFFNFYFRVDEKIKEPYAFSHATCNKSDCDEFNLNLQILPQQFHCSTGKYPINQSSCESCIRGCKQCQSSDVCTSCYSDYKIISSKCECKQQRSYSDGRTCKPCLQPCLACVSVSQCKTCIQGYFLDEKQSCLKCKLSSCKVCLSAQECKECEKGFVLNRQNICIENLYEKKAKKLFKMGYVEHREKFDYLKAIEMYSQALEIYKSIKEEQSQGCFHVLNQMGNIYWMQGNYESALECYNRAFSIIDKIFGKNSSQYSNILTNIGTVYDYQGNKQKARSYYDEALATIEKIYGKEHIQYAQILNNIGNIESFLNNFDKSIELKERVLKIVSNHYGDNHIKCTLYLNNLGVGYQMKGNTTKAMEYHKKALSIFEANKVQKHDNLGLTFLNIGYVLYDQGKISEAVESFKQAKKIYEQIYGPNNQNKNFKVICKEIQKLLKQ